MNETAMHVAEIVRNWDRDHYVAALYAPAGKRDDLLALFAFNHEIVKIRDLVSEPLPGEIRLQWWRDMLNDASGTETAGHPVAIQLGQAITRNSLPVDILTNMIDAHVFDLYCDPMPSQNDLEGYCGETAGAMIQLAGLVLDPAVAPDHGEAAGHGGCALKITQLLAGLAQQRQRQQCYIPADILKPAGMNAERFTSEPPGAGHLRAVGAMTALARHHHKRFVALAGNIPGSLRPVFLSVAPVPRLLNRIESAGLAIFETPVRVPPVLRQAAILMRAFRGW